MIEVNACNIKKRTNLVDKYLDKLFAELKSLNNPIQMYVSAHISPGSMTLFVAGIT